jgi:hypothetical protein
MMMDFVAILISKVNTMETLLENVEKHVICSFSYLKNFLCHIFYLLPLLLSIMSSLAFTKTFEFLPLPSVVESSIIPSLNNFYPPPILTKHHTWYLLDADLFISIHGILYGIYQKQLKESILFQEVLQHGQDHQIRIVPFHPIPFDILEKKIFNQFLALLYCGTTTLNHLTRNDWVDIKQLCIDWYLSHQTAMII